MLTEEEWDEISRTPGLSEDFIRENSYKVNWGSISQYQKLTEGFIKEFSDNVYWYCISCNQNLSEDFIMENTDQVNWSGISKYQKLSEKFIGERFDKVDWYNISCYQKLSESFIREFSDKVYWPNISKFQKLSEKFIGEFYDKVDLYYISKYQKLSQEFIKEFNLIINEKCWLYKDKEYKRKYIKDNTEYEIIVDKVIVYKSCRLDGYSLYNFQYYYEVGGKYETHANYNVYEDNSFGISAWTKEKALSYYDKGKLFKVEIDLEDIAAIVYDGNKIRASKVKILEEIIF
jgi:hypothetical protein